MAAEELLINWGNLTKFYEDLDLVKGQAAEIETYAREQVFTKAGFDYPLCVFQPMSDVLDTLADAFGDMRGVFDSRWDALVSALESAAQDARNADEGAQTRFTSPRSPFAGVHASGSAQVS